MFQKNKKANIGRKQKFIEKLQSLQLTISILLREFLKDITNTFIEYYRSAFNIPIRATIKTGLHFSVHILNSAIRKHKERNLEDIIRGNIIASISETPTRGRVVENILKKILDITTKVQDIPIAIGDKKHITLKVFFKPEKQRISNFETDFTYTIRMGDKEIGHIFGEITTEKTLRTHKDKIMAFANNSPTLVILAYMSPEDKGDMEENAREFLDSIASSNIVRSVFIPGYLVKYLSLCEDITEERLRWMEEPVINPLFQSLKVELGIISENVFSRYKLSAMSEKISIEEHRPEEAFEDVLRNISRNITTHMIPNGKKMSTTTFRKRVFDSLRSAESTLKKLGIKLSNDIKSRILREILHELKQQGIANWSAKYGDNIEKLLETKRAMINLESIKKQKEKTINIVLDILKIFLTPNNTKHPPRKTSIINFMNRQKQL